MSNITLNPLGWVKEKLGPTVNIRSTSQPKRSTQTYQKPKVSGPTNLQMQQQAWDKAARNYMSGQNQWNQNAIWGTNAAIAMQGPERYQARMNSMEAQRDVDRANLEAASTGGRGSRANEIAALEYELGQLNAKGDMASILRGSALKDQLLALRNQERAGSQGLLTQAMAGAGASKTEKLRLNQLGREEAALNKKMNMAGLQSNAVGNYFAPGRLLEESAQEETLTRALENYGLADSDVNRQYAEYIREAEERINNINRELLADTGKTNEERENDAEKIRQIQRGQELAFAQMNAAKANAGADTQMAKWNAAVAAQRAKEQMFYTALQNNWLTQEAARQGIVNAGAQPQPPPPARPGAGVKRPQLTKAQQAVRAKRNR